MVSPITVPTIRKTDVGAASRNALAEALAMQKFTGTIKAEKAAAARSAQLSELTGAAVSAEGVPAQTAALRELGATSPAAATDAFTFLSGLNKQQRDAANEKATFLSGAALGVLSAAEADKPALYEANLALATENGFDVSGLPQQYDPSIEPQLQAMVGQSMTMQQQLGAIEKATGGSQQIVQLQRAQAEARARGDTAAVQQIQRQIDKIGTITGRTPQDVPPTTKANITKNQNIIDDGENTLGLIGDIREVVASENLGVVGDIRMFWQGIRGQIEATGEALTGDAVDRGATGNVAAWFNPDLSTQELLGNQLAYRLALANNPDGRISDPDFKNAQKALGFDRSFTGADDVMARLSAFERQIVRAQDIAYRRLGQERPKVAKEPEITVDTNASSSEFPEGTETEPNVDGVIMIIRNGEWVVK